METWFSTEARSAGNARHAVRRCLRTTDLRLVEEVELLTSELFAHAAATTSDVGRVCVRVRQAGDRVHVEVAHESVDDAAPVIARDPLEGEILDRLLDAFSTRWGRYTSGHGEGGTWFETRLAR